MFGTTALCALCWLSGTICFEAVFTERLGADDYSSRDCLTAMQQCLDGRNGVIMQDLTLHDVSLVATDAGKACWRRQEIFADDSGARWQPIAEVCVAQVQRLGATMAGAMALPSAATTTTTAAAASGTSTRKWNITPPAFVHSLPAMHKQTLDALTVLACSYQRGQFAVRTLTDFCVASFTQDQFGVVQQVSPTLGDVLLCMLSTLLAAEKLIKQTNSYFPVGGGGGGSSSGSSSSSSGSSSGVAVVGPWRGSGDAAYTSCEAQAAVHALRDELSTGLYNIVGVFGPAVSQALNKSTSAGALPYGSLPDAALLLESFLKGEQ